MKKLNLTILLSIVFVMNSFSQSKVWVSDLGNGTYKNPVIHADYSDPDVCRVGSDYYMTASSFNCSPGLPILHSKDLVNWEIVNYAIKKQSPADVFAIPQHGNGVWAPSIRYHNKEFYICYGDPDYGIYILKTKNPFGDWSEPFLIKPGKGLIDACLFWDEDGKAYISHAFAGSRAGLKSIIAIFPIAADCSKALADSRIVFDGHQNHPTMEGTKFHKRNGYYYIILPAGGVSTGWQVALRSKNIYGPYEDKIVMHQGSTSINGPHQGAWVDTPNGENWFFHFQDIEAYGRVVHLQPMVWKNDWPVIGYDADGDGCGEPVLTYKKPNVGKIYPIQTPVESDEFNVNKLGLQWQWHANQQPLWYFTDESKGCLRLYSYPVPDNFMNLWNVGNLLLQKFPAPEFSATTKITFHPDSRFAGERTGLLVMGYDYAMISLEKTRDGLKLSQITCNQANKGGKEKVMEELNISDSTIYLKAEIKNGALCEFSYSSDNKLFTSIGSQFKASPGQWIGAKIGFFITRPKASNDGGYTDVDWFRVQ